MPKSSSTGKIRMKKKFRIHSNKKQKNNIKYKFVDILKLQQGM